MAGYDSEAASVASAAAGRDLYRAVFAALPHAVLVVDPAGRLIAHNAAADALFGGELRRPGIRCCELVGCGRGDLTRPIAFHCISAAALERGSPLREARATVSGQAVAVAASPLHGAAGAVIHVRPLSFVEPEGAPAAPKLRITTLGSVQLELAGARIGGDWIHHRPGQVLKYLVCARGHRVPTEELVDALWPGSGRSGVTRLRQAVLTLRDRLESDRPRHVPSRFVTATAGGYELDTGATTVDADAFEIEARAALLSRERSDSAAARSQLLQAAQLYTGSFLPDEPYTEWVLEERDRLRGLAVRVLRELAGLHLERGELPPATSALKRVSELEPLDGDVQRELITLLIRRGHHAEAARSYELFSSRFRRAFDREPDFSLAGLAAG